MGTRFLLTQESTVPDAVKERYLAAGPGDTVVTRAVDGQPQRVLRTDLVDRLERGPRVAVLARAVANAVRLRRLTRMGTRDLVREGLGMRRAGGLTWAQVAMAANAPLLTKAALVEGHLEAGILPTGQVAGSIDALPTVAEVVEGVVAEAAAVLHGLCGGDGDGDAERAGG
jgi:NAD(P)H-dependent flavin oxidoreductase YrpB (nitropropane dioxygenase family)